MKWKLIFSKQADKFLSKLDNNTRKMIVSWLINNINNCENPRLHGKALVGDKKDYWRYRIGSYRIIADIQDEVIIVEIINIGHRRDVYR